MFFYIAFNFSVTHTLRLHWVGKHWMTETTTNQTPLIQSLGGGTAM